jgi:hypothetical protein
MFELHLILIFWLIVATVYLMVDAADASIKKPLIVASVIVANILSAVIGDIFGYLIPTCALISAGAILIFVTEIWPKLNLAIKKLADKIRSKPVIEGLRSEIQRLNNDIGALQAKITAIENNAGNNTLGRD